MLHTTDQNQQSSASKTIKLSANLRTEPVVRTLKSTIVNYKDSISHTKNNDTIQNRNNYVYAQILALIVLIKNGRKLLRIRNRRIIIGIGKLRTNDNPCWLPPGKLRGLALNSTTTFIGPTKSHSICPPPRLSSGHQCSAKTSLNTLGLPRICTISLCAFNRSRTIRFRSKNL